MSTFLSFLIVCSGNFFYQKYGLAGKVSQLLFMDYNALEGKKSSLWAILGFERQFISILFTVSSCKSYKTVI